MYLMLSGIFVPIPDVIDVPAKTKAPVLPSRRAQLLETRGRPGLPGGKKRGVRGKSKKRRRHSISSIGCCHTILSRSYESCLS